MAQMDLSATAVPDAAPSEDTTDTRGSRLRGLLAGARDRLHRAGSDRGEGSDRDPAGRVQRLLELMAMVALPLGLVVIGLGWYGAAHTPFLFEQIPYLISGGLLGVGLVTVGGLLYLGGWLSRMASEERERSQRLEDTLGELVAAFRSGAVAAGAGASSALDAGSRAQTTDIRGGALLATPKGTMVHRPDCAVVAGRDDVRAVDPDDDGFTPCAMCDPFAEQGARAQRPW